MKKLLFFTILFIFHNLVLSDDKVHNILILKEWKPYYSLDRNSKPTGYSIELFEAIAKDIGLKYRYKIYDNWAQIVSYCKSGEKYIIPNTGITEMRASYTLFSKPTDSLKISYFKRKNSYEIINKNSLKNKTIGVVESNVCARLVDNEILKKIEFKDQYLALTALISGEIDALCYPKSLFEHNLKTLNLEDKIIVFGEPLKEIKRAVGFSLNNKELVEKFNNSIEKLKENGTYNKIYSKWFVKKDLVSFSYEQIILILLITIIVFLIVLFAIYYITIRNRWLLSQQELEEGLSKRTKELSFALSLYDKALSATEEGIWDWDVSTNKVYYSPVFKTMLGYSVDEIENELSAWEKLLHPDDFDNARTKALNLASGKISRYSSEFRLRCKDGSYKWILSKARIIEKDKENRPKRLVGVHIDLTEQKKKEQELLEEKNKFESIFKNSKDGIAILDMESNFIEFNDAYLQILGYTKEELSSMSCISLTPEDTRAESIKALEKVITEGFVENFEKRCITKSGDQITVNMSIKLLPDKNRMIAISKNITALKMIEKQEKLISMGEMIGNIAHQWRQPLAVISMAANSIRLDSELGNLNSKDINKLVHEINENSQYLSNTINTFRDFIKGDDTYSLVSLYKVLQTSIMLTEASRKENFIELVVDIDENIKVEGNENELEQVLINILNNAKDKLIEKEDEDRYIFLSTNRKNKKVEIKVLDNAGGFNLEIIDRVIEPYFTTKHQSVGTGLGLTIAQKIITRHKGTLTVYNESFDYNGKHYIGASVSIVLEINVEQ